ncbi:MAG: DUF4352 domain-containing protein [Eubacterium sp.]|nr:DUF4352 domain-containing protein [Eubacterium sp.]
MRKNRCLLLGLCMSMILLSGCSVAELSEENQDKVAEYAAQVVLRHDANYENKLVTSSQENPISEEIATPEPSAVVTATPEAASTPDSSETGGQPEEQFQEVSLDELYQIQDVSIAYQSYDICSKYPEKSDYPMTAKKGEKFLVLNFEAKNQTDSKKKVDLIQRRINYELMLDETMYNPTIVMLTNGGLNYFKTTLSPGEVQKVVLMYNIPKEETKAKTMVLTIKDGEKAHTILLKTDTK